MKQHRQANVVHLLVLGGAFIAGCSGYAGPRSVANPDPAVKIPEIRKAVEADDKSVMPQLVRDLDSDDAAVRFYAISALERFTGETHGYDWTVADRFARRPALERWRAAIGQPTAPAATRASAAEERR